MRFKIIFHAQGNANILPINYQYELASWVYKVLDRGDTDFARWLHDQGFKSGEQYFKFFSFSQLVISRSSGKILKDRILLNRGEVYFYISFLPEKATESFVRGLFKDTVCEIVNKEFRATFTVKSIEMIPRPEFAKTMQFKLLSPVVISKPVEYKGKLQHEYLSPENPEYEKYFCQNLFRKYQARYEEMQKSNTDFFNINSHVLPSLEKETTEIGFKLLNNPRKKGITLKSYANHPVKVIGYLYSFELTAPGEIIETGYYGGFGEVCSMGFGFAEGT